MWPDATPAPRTAASFWLRAITHLHSRALIADEHLSRTLTAIRASSVEARDALATMLTVLTAPSVLVVDDAHAAIDPPTYRALLADIAHLLDQVTHLRVVLAETAATDVDVLVDSANVTRADVSTTDLAEYMASAGHCDGSAESGSGPAESSQSGYSVGELSGSFTDPSTVVDICALTLPPSIDRRLAEALVGRPRAAELLDHVTDAGLGTWVKDALGSERFEFRGGTRIRARDLLRRRWPSVHRRSCQILARHFANEGLTDIALDYAIDSEDIDLIGGIALRLFPVSFSLPAETTNRASSLPFERLREHPLLAVWTAEQLDLGARPGLDAREFFEAAVAACRRSSDEVNATERLVILGIEAYALRRLGAGDDARSTAIRFDEQARNLLAAGRFDESLDHAFATYAYQVGVTLIYSEEWQRATRLLRTVERFCALRRIGHRRNSALAAQSYVSAIAGDTNGSADLARRVEDEDWPRVWLTGNTRSYFLLARIVRELARGDVLALQRAIAAFRPTAPVTEHWDIVLIGDVFIDLSRGRTTAARTRFESVVRRKLTDGTHPGIVNRLMILQQILLLFGETTPALSRSKRSTERGPLSLALDAARDIDRKMFGDAATKLGQAAGRVKTPLEQHVVFTVLARLGVHREDSDSIRNAASHLYLLHANHGLRIAFSLLSDDERAEVLAALDDPSSLSSGFSKVPAPPARDRPLATAELTPTQLRVLRELSKRGDRRAVAHALFLAPGTVKAHLRAIYRKFDAHSQDEAIARAAAQGLL